MKKYIAALICCMILLLTACTAGQEQVYLPEEEPLPLPTQMAEFLSEADVEQATGMDIADVEQHNDGSAGYYAVDGNGAVYTASLEMTADEFVALRNEIGQTVGIVDAPNLAENAFWCEAQSSLTAYQNGIAVEVRVEYVPANTDESLLAARQLAALLLEKL